MLNIKRKIVCPKCGAEFEEEIWAVATESFSELEAKKRFPNRNIPPYPYGVSGDMMPECRECDRCGELFWTAEYSRHHCGRCDQ